jgi:hypothetical protein
MNRYSVQRKLSPQNNLTLENYMQAKSEPSLGH